MPDEEKKKKRKLVVEETSPAEPIVEAEIPAEAAEEPSEEIKEPEVQEPEIREEVEEKPQRGSPEDTSRGPVGSEGTPPGETPKKSILIPTDEAAGPEGKNTEDADSKVSNFWVILLALFIIASLAGGGILVFRAGVEKGKLESGNPVESIASSSPTPAASPATEVKREEIKVQVLNGTGKAGIAATAKDYLEGLGYKDVEAGNADSSGFTETVISIKDAKKNYLETLKSDLAEKYEVSAAASTLSSGSDFDAVVTVGTSTK